jgi:hypothetical protein
MNLRTRLIGALIALGVSGASASAGVVYSQPDGSGCSPSCWTSTQAPGLGATDGFQTFDNFSLTQNAGITSVSWEGIYIPFTASDGPVAPDTATWDIGFYGDSSGQPGGNLYSTSLPAADVTTKFLGTTTFNGGTVNVYDFTAALPSGGFAATAGDTYWFSPLAVQPNADPFFSWSASGTQPAGAMAFQNEFGGVSGSVPDDRAFTLSAASGTPEASAWALMMTGVGGVGAALRLAKRGGRFGARKALA